MEEKSDSTIIAGGLAVLGLVAAGVIYAATSWRKDNTDQKNEERLKSLLDSFNESNQEALDELCTSIKKTQNGVVSFSTLNKYRNQDWENSFLIACRQGKIESVQKLLSLLSSTDRQKLFTESINKYGCNCFHLTNVNDHHQLLTQVLIPTAIQVSDPSCNVLLKLLSQGTYADFLLPFHLAVAKGSAPCVLSLLALVQQDPTLSTCISLNIADQRGHNSLIIAACNGHATLLSQLLSFDTHCKEGSNDSNNNNNNNSSSSNSSEVSYREDLNVEQRNKDGRTVLHFAAMKSYEHITKMFLDHLEKYRPEVNLEAFIETSDLGGNSALHIASSLADVQVIKELIGHKAKVNMLQTTKSGDTVLNMLVKHQGDKSSKKIIKTFSFLLDAIKNHQINSEKDLGSNVGLDLAEVLVSVKTGFGKTIIHDLVKYRQWQLLDLLLEFCRNNTPKSSSSASTSKNSTTILLEARDHDGMSALHEAVLSWKQIKTRQSEALEAEKTEQQKLDDKVEIEKSCLKTIACLVDSGMDPNIKDHSDSTPLYLVCFHTDSPVVAKIVKYLLSVGADPLIDHLYGWNCLHAIQYTIAAKSSNNGQPQENVEEAKQVALEVEALLKHHVMNNMPGKADYLTTEFDPKKPRDFSKQKIYQRRSGKHNLIPLEERNEILKSQLNLKGVAEYILNKEKAQKGSVKVLVMTGAGISTSAGIPDFRGRESGMYNNKDTRSIFSIETLVKEPEKFYAFVKATMLPIREGQIRPTPTHYFIKLLEEKGILLRNFTQNIDMLEHYAGIDDDKVIECHGTFRSFRCLNFNHKCKEEIIDDEPSLNVIWNDIKQGKVPMCSKGCGSHLRPNVTFFGEGMSVRYADGEREDLDKCDVLIVMGTTLLVYPFAGMVSKVGLKCVRLLINNEASGLWRDIDEEVNYRDVMKLGKIDDGVKELVSELGWEQDLEDLMKSPTNKNNDNNI